MLDAGTFGLYTLTYENYQTILYKTAGDNIHYAAFGFNWFGVDVANYVHDEIFT